MRNKVISMPIVVGMLVAGLMYSQAKPISLWGDSLLINDISVAIISGNVLVSNGYYWMIPDDLISAMELATKDL